jgi:hypothetical protein
MPPRKSQEISQLKAKILALTNELKTSKAITTKIASHLQSQVNKPRARLAKLTALHNQAYAIKNDGADGKVTNLKQYHAYQPKAVTNMVFTLFVLKPSRSVRMTQEPRKGQPGKFNAPHLYYVDGYLDEHGAYVAENRYRNVVIPNKILDNFEMKETAIMTSGKLVAMKMRIPSNWVNTFLDDLKAFSSSNAKVVEDIKRLLDGQGYGVGIVIDQLQRFATNNTSYPEASREQLYDTDKKMQNRFINYKLAVSRFAITKFKDLWSTEEYDKKDSCIPNAVLNEISTVWNTHPRHISKITGKVSPKKELSYEKIWSIVWGDIPYDPEAPMNMSFEEARAIFRWCKIKAYLVNPSGRLEDSYNPEDEGLALNGNIKRSIFIVRKDGHAFWVNNTDMKQKIMGMNELGHHSGKCWEDAPQAPKHYKTKKDSIKPFQGVVESLDDVIGVIAKAMAEGEQPPSDIRILANCPDLKPLLSYLYFEEMYEPSIVLDRCNNITQLTMKTDDTYIHISTPNFGDGDMVNDLDLKSLSTDELIHYENMKHTALTTLVCNQVKSTYGKGVLPMLKKYNRSAFSKMFTTTDSECVGLDMNLAYVSWIYLTNYVPVFCEFDEFQSYDHHELEPMNMYYVKRTNVASVAEKVYMPNTYDIVYGFSLKFMTHCVKILGFMRPIKLVPNPFRDMIKDIMEDTTLERPYRKQALLSSIGNLGKYLAHTSRSKLFRTYEDAKRTQKEYGGEIKYIGINPIDNDYDSDDDDAPRKRPEEVSFEKNIYVLEQSASAEMVDGFLPIQHLIYDACRIKCALMCKRVEKRGGTVLGVNTDCVIIPKTDLSKLNKHYPRKEDIDPTSVSILGQYKIEKPSFPKAGGVYKYNHDASRPMKMHKPKSAVVHHMKDEWDVDEFCQMVDNSGQRVMVTADDPGNGKSYLCMKYAQYCMAKGLNVVIACPQNSQALEVRKEWKLNAMTLASLCSYRLNDDGVLTPILSQNKIVPDVLIVEEAMQFSTPFYQNSVFLYTLSRNYLKPNFCPTLFYLLLSSKCVI